MKVLPALDGGRRIAAGRQGELAPELLHGMFRLRHEVFRVRLGWDVESRDGMERDVYDDLHPYYVILHDGPGNVLGCCRLLPTAGRYMLGEVPAFRAALGERPPPRDRRVWEISRMAVLNDGAPPAKGIGDLAAALTVRAARAVEAAGGDTLLALVTLGLARKIRAHDVPVTPLAPPARIADLTCQAITMPTGVWRSP
ncbi:acyl-homoserine-lactone synthase [Spongiactinospora sp. TRM90649]|uniref:acyl-homoserine-lactone synthase n=1 Tax=Spongiactinospora sp. TRM90649 TaxID=3031114 RepID=UPI0023F97F90|nr:acyl-homoserine-lactone synthase [Spongiactinospora sp. TRM90649]MDF5752603.1 acyl-homoserine-lactone synthase [Spongiactinospora sp. TRM90649]